MDIETSDNERPNNYAESEAGEDGAILSDTENQENNPENPPNDDNKDDEANKRIVKPKRIVRNPRPKLNVETLKGRRGLKSLDGYFKDVKYEGKGHEVDDLQIILKTYEHWCHRLYPKLPFDDCIKKIETLGHKKPMITFLKKIRSGLEDDETTEVINQEAENIEEDALPNRDIPDIFDSLIPENRRKPPKIVQEVEEEIVLTEEQLERIRINRELALQRKKTRMLKTAKNDQINTEENVTASADVTADNSRRTSTAISSSSDDSDLILPQKPTTPIAQSQKVTDFLSKTNTPPLVSQKEQLQTDDNSEKLINEAILDEVTHNSSILMDEVDGEAILAELSQSSAQILTLHKENIIVEKSGVLSDNHTIQLAQNSSDNDINQMETN